MVSSTPLGDRSEQLGDRQRVVVVGAGIAGLVVARELALAGVPVTVLEASDRVGGQLVPVRVGGVETDAAAESFAIRGGAVEALLEEIGLGDQVVAPLDSPAWLIRAAGDALPLPAVSLLGIPATPLAEDVIAAIGTAGALRAQLDALLPVVRPERYRTVGQLVRRRMGRAVLDRLVAPVVRGVHSTTPDAVDLDVAAPGLRAALARSGSLASAVADLRAASPAGSQVAGIDGGVHRIAHALETRATVMGAELRLGALVTGVDADGATLEDGSRVEGRVVVAAPGVASEALRRRAITLATAVVDSPGLDPRPRGTGALVVEGAAGVVARAFTHASAKWAWLGERLPAHRHVIRLSYDEFPDDLADTVVSDVRAIAGVDVCELVDVTAQTWVRTLQSGVPADGVRVVGEASSRTGLAAIVAHARTVAAELAAPQALESGDGPGNEESDD